LDYENVRSEYTINCWFDKNGDSTWTADPEDADENIQIDISGDVTAQDVSDTIESSLNAHGLLTCDNAAGTTNTITNHYNGACTNINAQDSGLAVAVSVTGVDNVYNLFVYSITNDALSEKGAFDVSLMHNRNTIADIKPECFALEKAFALEAVEFYKDKFKVKVYQISRRRGVLNFISLISVSEGDVIVAITDTYLIIDKTGSGGNVELWKFIDIAPYLIHDIEIHTKERKYSTCHLEWVRDTDNYADPPVKDQFVQVFGRYSSQNLP